MENFLSKPTQKELRTKYETALQEVWKNRKGVVDEKMVKFCLGKIAAIIPMSNGRLTSIEKPCIEKHFCFGWSSCGQGASYEEAQAAHTAVNENLAEYFKENNLEGFDRRYEDYIKAAEHNESQGLNTIRMYYSQPTNNPLRNLNFNNIEYPEFDKKAGAENITAEDLSNFAAAIKFVRADFEKRLDSYLKKYGTKKLHTWTYWVDD